MKCFIYHPHAVTRKIPLETVPETLRTKQVDPSDVLSGLLHVVLPATYTESAELLDGAELPREQLTSISLAVWLSIWTLRI
jgi:hypothetical protein